MIDDEGSVRAAGRFEYTMQVGCASLLLCALGCVASVGCDPSDPPAALRPSSTSQPASSGTTRASAAPSAPSEPVLSEQEAVKRVLATATAKRAMKGNPDYAPKLEPAGQLLFVTLAPDKPKDFYSYPKFRIDRRTEKIEAESHCELGGWVSVERRDFEERALDHVVALPEVRGLARQLDKASGGRVRLTVRIEDCDASDGPDEAQMYVGEAHDDHTVRSLTVRVKDPGLEVRVADLGEAELVPYATWSKTERARRLR